MGYKLRYKNNFFFEHPSIFQATNRNHKYRNMAIYNYGKLKTLKNHFIVFASPIFEFSFW